MRLVTSGSKTIAEVTEQFELTESALREWVKRAARAVTAPSGLPERAARSATAADAPRGETWSS